MLEDDAPEPTMAPLIPAPLTLIQLMRLGDREAFKRAYRALFASDTGRMVLCDILQMAGVGARFGPKLSDTDQSYALGRHDLAIDVMNAAGFDQPSAVLMTLIEQLEGQTNDRSSGGDGDDPDRYDPDNEPDS